MQPISATASPMDTDSSTMENVTPTASASMLVATASTSSSLCRTSPLDGCSSSSLSPARLSRIIFPPIHASSTKAIHGASLVT